MKITEDKLYIQKEVDSNFTFYSFDDVEKLEKFDFFAHHSNTLDQRLIRMVYTKIKHKSKSVFAIEACKIGGLDFFKFSTIKTCCANMGGIPVFYCVEPPAGGRYQFLRLFPKGEQDDRLEYVVGVKDD